MGYEIHICKTRNWMDSEKKPIIKEEIFGLVSSYPELKLLENDLIECSGIPIFVYDGSKISLKSPNNDQIAFSFKLAQKLNCFLVGDEQELYTYAKKYLGLIGAEVLKIIPE